MKHQNSNDSLFTKDQINISDPTEAYNIAKHNEYSGNTSNALQYYKLATDLGHCDAPLNVALILHSAGQYKDVPHYLELSIARTNNRDAHTLLAKYYALGKVGNWFNRERHAFEHLLAAAKQGSGDAQYGLALAYADGHGVKESMLDYALWLRCSQLNGYKRGIEYLNRCMNQNAEMHRVWCEELQKVDQIIRKHPEYVNGKHI